MTAEEHHLLIMLFARMNQANQALAEILKSRGIITGDDMEAFNFAGWADDRQLLNAVIAAREEYLKISRLAGVVVPPEV